MTTLETLAARLRPLAQSLKTYPPDNADQLEHRLSMNHDETLALDALLQQQLAAGPVEQGQAGARFMQLAGLAIEAGAEASILIHLEADHVGLAGATAQHTSPARRRLHQDILDALARAFGERGGPPIINQHATGFVAGQGEIVLSDIKPGAHPEEPTPPAKPGGWVVKSRGVVVGRFDSREEAERYAEGAISKVSIEPE